MKKLMTLSMLFFLTALTAQTIDVKTIKSEIFKDKKKYSSLVFSESDDKGGIVNIREYVTPGFTIGGIGTSTRVKGYYIEYFDGNLNLKYKYDFKVDKEYLRGVMIKNEKIHLILSEYKRKERLFEVSVLISPIEEISFIKKSLFSIDKDDVMKRTSSLFLSNSSVDKNTLGNLYFSKHKEYLAFNFDIVKKKEETHRIYVFNDKFEQQYIKEFQLSIRDKYFKYETLDINESTGDIYLLGKSFHNKSRREKKNGKVNYHYELYKMNSFSQDKLTIETDQHSIGSLKLAYNKGKVICIGFYSDKNDWRYKGVCRFDIDDQEFSLSKKIFLPFSEQFMEDKYGNRKQKELYDISYRKIIFTEENDVVINGEEFYTTTSTYMDGNGNVQMRTYYNFDDIIALKITNEGKLAWARNINKSQTGFNGYVSYTSTYYNNKNYFFINCSDKITKLSKNRIRFNGKRSKKSNFYGIVIDENGNIAYRSILDDKENEVPFMVKDGIVGNDEGSEIIFLGRRKRKKQLLKVEIQ